MLFSHTFLHWHLLYSSFLRTFIAIDSLAAPVIAIQIILCSVLIFLVLEMFKDTYWGGAPSNKTPALTKCMNMDSWIVVIPNQLFIRSS